MAKHPVDKAKGKQNGKVSQEVKSHRDFLLRVFLFSVMVVGVVAWTDYRGYFNPDYTNDHTRRKWNAYYELTRKAPVDVVMIGNSHLYTGMNPEHLSNALGATCFILASPGTTMTDAYFSLKEAVKVKKPKMVILETFTLYDYDSHELKAGALSDQFKSFAARKDVGQKLASMPVLFQSDNYLPAWSNTIRNHSFIFTDTTQLKQNILLGRQKPPREQGLYLGRYIRFTSGLEKNTLKRYDEPGFVAYNYAEKLPGDEAKKYLKKAIALCKREKIELVLLTLPMYHRHLQGYEIYKNEILKTIGDKQSWLDMQLHYDTTAFTPESFENTVAPNQHMTYQGSLVAAYKLAHYLKKYHAEVIPDRSGERKWIELFYASDGFFINNSPLQDGVSKVLMTNVPVASEYQLKELILVPEQGAKQLMLKLVKPAEQMAVPNAFEVLADIQVERQTMTMPVKLARSPLHQPMGHLLYVSEYLHPETNIGEIKTIQVQ
ncbi:MAG: hypothetical protein PHQ11_05085 [Paludibacter sp.]|nr:hypothetical protein [Paludibacter sp.]